jgi:hypothetical protein
MRILVILEVTYWLNRMNYYLLVCDVVCNLQVEV